MSETNFWQDKALAEMSQAEWEALCDGCGYCCLVKLEDEDTGQLYTTNVSCRLLDTETCRCQNYPQRNELVPQCLVLSADKPELYAMLPETCAYRCLAQGKELAEWHPLCSGDQDTVRSAGVAVCDIAVSEEYVHPDQLEDHIIHPLESDD